jgi:hypothetical protein
MNELQKQQQLIPKILWGALFFSNFVYFYIVWADLIQTANSVASNDMLSKVPYLMAIITGSISFLIHKRVTNPERIREKFKTLSTELPKTTQMTPQMYEEYNAMSDIEKKKYLLRSSNFVLIILSMALAQSVNILGLIGPFLGTPREHYYYFFTAAVCLMLFYFPKNSEEINRLR